MNSVTVTELEFNKLARYTEAAASLEAQFELMKVKGFQQVKEAHELRNAYLQKLQELYPDFDPNGTYQYDEETLTLRPKE